MAANTTLQVLIDSTNRSLIKYTYETDGTVANSTPVLNVANLAYALNSTGQMLTTGIGITSTGQFIAGQTNQTSYAHHIKRIFGNSFIKSGYGKLQWAGNANTTIITFGLGPFDYNFDPMGLNGNISNPDPANNNGNIVLSTVGAAAGDAFTFFIDIKKEAQSFSAGQGSDPAAFNWYTFNGTKKPS